MKNASLLMILGALLFVSLLLPSFSLASWSSLSRGSSLSVEVESDVLVSPDNSYTCGFYKIASNAYTFSIWFSNSANKTPAWTANRDRPVYSHGSRVTMRKDGSLVLTDADGTVVWSTKTSSTQAYQVQLLNIGNLVVKDIAGNISWQSFDSPTDTLLATQSFTRTTKLVSMAAKGSPASGYYSLLFDNDNVLKLIYNGPEFSGIYWPNPYFPVWIYNRNSYNSSRYGALYDTGEFESSDNFTLTASDMGNEVLRRLTLDYDGNLRLYSLNESEGTWSITWEAIPELCQVFGLCGQYGICSYSQSKPFCSCPPNHDMSDPSDWSKGCKRKYNISCDNVDQLSFLELPETDFWGFDQHTYLYPESVEKCMQHCLENCSCEAILYKYQTGDCFTKGPLFNGLSFPNTPSSVYLKVPKNLATSRVTLPSANNLICNGNEAQVEFISDMAYTNHSETKWMNFYYFLAAVGLTEVLFALSGWWFIFRKDSDKISREEGYNLMLSHFRKFTYKELKKATRNFKDELGRGGSGAVFKGALDDKRVVAVKKLENVTQGEEEFQAELSLIGRMYHMNLVRMLGFCSEGSSRLLVLEYVENGALDEHLFGSQFTTSVLEWEKRFKIAVGVAKGLAYLHHECLEWVVHCDVKPENILLDSDFEPKISDFGLAKLSSRAGIGSNVSRIRGTRGYLAPEWTTNVPITSKVDVYSYGVVLLELVTGSRLSSWSTEKEMSVNLKLMTLSRRLKAIVGTGKELSIENFIDFRLNGQFNYKQAEAMVEISLSCLEIEGSQRPAMDQVVQMLLSSES